MLSKLAYSLRIWEAAIDTIAKQTGKNEKNIGSHKDD
jgi:hypothetical protein